MRSSARIVVSQPLSVVESHLWDVGSWPALFDRLESTVRSTHERYTVQIRRRWHSEEAVIRVRWRAKDHKVTWQTEQGPSWSGEFSLTPLSGSRTMVTLTTTPVGSGPQAWVSRWFPRGQLGGPADLDRLRRRMDVLPHPHRLPSPRTATNTAMNDLDEVHRLSEEHPRPRG
jgi:hypothetical protein